MSDKHYFILAILAGLLVAGIVGVIAYTGTKSAEREQELATICLDKGGTWIDEWDACIYGKGAQ